MRLIVGITGTSGVIMGYHLLLALRQIEHCEIHLIVTEGAKQTWALETKRPLSELTALCDHLHDDGNLAAVIASGSFLTDGLIVMPCSMKTLAGIVSGYASNLLVRAADVCLKEGRKVVLVPRETPLSKLHLRNLREAADLGCAIVPPMLTFYNAPTSVEDQINHIVAKALLQFGIESPLLKPWEGVEA